MLVASYLPLCYNLIRINWEREKMLSAIYPVPASEVRLPFYLLGIGRTSPEFHVKRDKGLTSHQFLYTAKGCGILEVGEMVATDADLTAFEKIFARIYSLAADNLHNGEKCSLLIYNAVLAAKEIFGGKQEENNTGNLIADNAVRYINEHYGDDITLNELACLSGVSPQYFDRVFRERLNMRPMEYIARVKISKAKSMLLDCDMSVTQLSKSLGYTSPTYFGIVFKKYEGISPSEFRKNSGSVI